MSLHAASKVVLDPTFGPNDTGIVINTVGVSSESHSMEVFLGDRIVIGGVSDGHVLIFRYTSGGALDTTFGTNGSTVRLMDLFVWQDLQRSQVFSNSVLRY